MGLALWAPSAVADEPAPSASAAVMSDAERDRQAEAIARTIMSPFCPGRTVSACPNAGPWREDIRRWVGEGVAADEIKRRLAERVPEHNLAGVPKNRLGWVLPTGLALGAVGILVFLLRYLVGPGAGAAAGGEAPATGARSGAKATNAKGAKASDDASRPAPGTANATGAGGDGPPDATNGTGKVDWDARLDRELETLEN